MKILLNFIDFNFAYFFARFSSNLMILKFYNPFCTY